MGVPGASGTVLELIAPYSKLSLIELIGSEPTKYVCPETARELATAAYRRALHLEPHSTQLVGLGVTCALAAQPPKRGDQACQVATHTAAGTREYSVAFVKGKRERFAEDAVASRVVVLALSEACGLGAPALAAQLAAELDSGAGEGLRRAEHPVGDPLCALAEQRVALVEMSRGRVAAVGATGAQVILSGSFNPLHEGHRGLLAAACAACGSLRGAFELSVTNADKGVLPMAEITARAAQFAAADTPPIVLTDAPLFVAKAKLMPGSVFVVGYDTAVRIVSPKYYGGSDEAMREVLRTIRDRRCSFMVAGRLVGEQFFTVREMQLPAGFEGLFRPLPDFRNDISSTEIRARRASASSL